MSVEPMVLMMMMILKLASQEIDEACNHRAFRFKIVQ